MKIALLNDIHDGPAMPNSSRKCEIAPILLKRAVRRLNELEKPDVTLMLGDLLNDGTQPDAEERLQRLKTILDKLKSPYLAIPGNHDGDINAFYRVFDRPKEIEEIAGVRFLPFLDEEQPHYCAKRSQPDIDRFKQARKDFNGPIVSLQHVCLYPPERADVPHNFTNATDVIRAMKASGVTLSVSGHHHPGAHDIRDENVRFVNAPALCEKPFYYTILECDANGHFESNRHTLAMPRLLRLVDTHLHTQMAYCSDDMNIEASITLARYFNLAGICFTEHSGQLYFNKKDYWSKMCLREGMSAAPRQDNRMAEYLAYRTAWQQDRVCFGLEADCDFQGNLLIASEDRSQFNHIVGALHGLPEIADGPDKMPRLKHEFLHMVEKTLQQGVISLAHPFRVFGRSHLPVPEELFEPTAKLLKKYNVAAELNFHTNRPPVAFVKTCLDLDVHFTFASDAHDLSEIGDFAYHIDLLKQAGFDGDLGDILTQPTAI